jgi:hypothetical protein
MDYKFKTKPYAHQITALEKSWNKEAFAYIYARWEQEKVKSY